MSFFTKEDAFRTMHLTLRIIYRFDLTESHRTEYDVCTKHVVLYHKTHSYCNQRKSDIRTLL